MKNLTLLPGAADADPLPTPTSHGQVCVAPDRVQVPASQHAPALHDEMPVQWTSQLVPPHRMGAGQALTPAQLRVLVAPSKVTV
jgi:hypothetical protein